MKTEQLAFVILLSAFLFITCCEKDNETNLTFHDDNFLNALIELGIDTDGDGSISSAEAKSITFLDVSSDSISDMTGIEAFINLNTLFCFGNQLTSLDVSKNTQLICLACFDNQLSTLDVSNNVLLEGLHCNHNQLTTLDVSNNAVLEELNVG